jgi:hypothetical protein
MLSRRQFLQVSVRTASGATVALVLGPLACGSDASTRLDTSPTLTGCDGLGGTSTIAAGHSHGLCIPQADTAAASAAGAAYTTSVEDGHTHEVRLDRAQLQALAAGERVDNLRTSEAEGHTHVFAIEGRGRAPVVDPIGNGNGGY